MFAYSLTRIRVLDVTEQDSQVADPAHSVASARTLAPGRSQVNIMRTMKREHSRKPDEMYELVESCSSGPFLELFARGTRPGWKAWGNQAETYEPDWPTYSNHSGTKNALLKKEQLRLIEQERTAFKV